MSTSQRQHWGETAPDVKTLLIHTAVKTGLHAELQRADGCFLSLLYYTDCHIWKFDMFLSVRSFKTGGHRSVHRRLAHLLQQRPVAKNGGELLPSCFCPQLWNMQCCIQVQFGKVSVSVCRSWPVRCFTCGSTSLFSPSPSSSFHSPFGCCSRCSHWLPSTNGCSEGRTLCVCLCVCENVVLYSHSTWRAGIKTHIHRLLQTQLHVFVYNVRLPSSQRNTRNRIFYFFSQFCFEVRPSEVIRLK